MGGGLSREASAARSERDATLASWDVNRAPFTVAWEMTKACPYVCRHCRADAQPYRNPSELSTEEALHVVDQLAGFGSVILVLTGGDPMARKDLETIAAAANDKGLRVALTPSVTARATDARIHALHEAGVRRVALSIDGPDAAVHDSFRGLPGSFARTMQVVESLHAEGLPLQVNTTIAKHNAHLLGEMADLMGALGAVQWSLFFLVPVGRALAGEMLSAAEHERIFHWVFDLARRAPFDVKATEAPAYRRVVVQRTREQRATTRPGDGAQMPVLAGAGFRYADGLNRPTIAIGDAKGFMFISDIGDVCPSGFLPVSVGNVREHSPVDLYRDSPLFRSLRESDRLEGRCGRCEFKELCGGSRARAYAMTGNAFAEDPSCIYEPGGNA